MPCLIIVGHPSAGKTTLAKLLKTRALLHDAIDEVIVLNEETECDCVQNDDDENERDETSSMDKNNKVITTKQELYETSSAEKQTRGALKASFDRAVKKSGGNNSSSRRLVILDSLNYIKGFRYELHCISKAAGEKHGVLWVLNRFSIVQQWNKNYSSVLLQELISRFEPPDDRNRWDKPLFIIDVAAAGKLTSSSIEDNNAQTRKSRSSKNEVLEHSVYNMHSLGEAFGTSRTTEQTDNNAVYSSIGAESQRPNKSAFATVSGPLKTPKKSAFQRRKKVSPPSEKDEKKIVSTYNKNKVIIDTSIMNSTVNDATIASDNFDEVGERTSTSSSVALKPVKPNPGQRGDDRSLEEQLDEILDIFLLRTKNLKEGMSTRQY
mmetsp:Transcript_9376/g.19930  ORF Transcript_9376/g.19930 Transcript_9376/m.19930 type:complete len:379 (+) Transcript_9376:65-1201(+)